PAIRARPSVPPAKRPALPQARHGLSRLTRLPRRSRLALTASDCFDKDGRMTTPILVTGGAGFLGSHLVSRLLEQGESVRVLERPGARIGHLPLDRIDLVWADIRDRRAVRGAVRGCREVYHLAANPNLWAQQRGSFLRVNYHGTVNVLDEALRAGV